MTRCEKNHCCNDRLKGLPLDPEWAGRQKCTGCAYERGLEAGRQRDELVSLDLDSLPESRAGTVQHRSPHAAWAAGYQEGVKSSYAEKVDEAGPRISHGSNTVVVERRTGRAWLDVFLSSAYAGKLGEGTLFRGARDYIDPKTGELLYGLVPGALRSDCLRTTAKAQAKFEMSVLQRFATQADHAGLPLPRGMGAMEITEIARRPWWRGMRHGRSWDESTVPCHYPLELLELAALAQHWGCPTRLLDWTTDRRVAAYFATENARKSDPAKGKPVMVMWALLAARCCWRSPLVPEPDPNRAQHGDEVPVLRVDLPAAENIRMFEQRGTFLMPHPRHPKISGREDWYVEHRDIRTLFPERRTPSLIAFVVPADEADDVQRLLTENYGVRASCLYKSFDRVTEEALRGLSIG